MSISKHLIILILGSIFLQNNNRTMYSWFMHHRSVNSIYLASDNVQTLQICIFINGSTGDVVVKAHTFFKKKVGIQNVKQ